MRYVQAVLEKGAVDPVNEERVLALDMSTKTGWSLQISSKDSITLEAYGQIEAIPEPEGQYPVNYVNWAYECFGHVIELIDKYAPDVLVIEETASGSKNSYSQKILEFIHFLVAKSIKETNIKAVYFLTEQWRRETGCKMSKEESLHNKEVKKYKEKNVTKVAYGTDGKRIGKITRKHVNVRRANEVFGESLKEPLRKKDEDTADSLLLGYAYHLRRLRTI